VLLTKLGHNPFVIRAKKYDKILLLYGHKGMANYAGVHVRTLLRWHYQRARIPYVKVGQRVVITVSSFLNYLHILSKHTLSNQK
jgi:hypothetical protein